MLQIMRVMRGKKNPNNPRKSLSFLPLSSWIITQFFVPHSNPKCPHNFVNGSDKRRIGKIQQNAMVIFAVFLWL